jgi:hypothetical protein
MAAAETKSAKGPRTLTPAEAAAFALIEALASHVHTCTEGSACMRAPHLMKRIDVFTRTRFTERSRKRIMKFLLERLVESSPKTVQVEQVTGDHVIYWGRCPECGSEVRCRTSARGVQCQVGPEHKVGCSCHAAHRPDCSCGRCKIGQA